MIFLCFGHLLVCALAGFPSFSRDSWWMYSALNFHLGLWRLDLLLEKRCRLCQIIGWCQLVVYLASWRLTWPEAQYFRWQNSFKLPWIRNGWWAYSHIEIPLLCKSYFLKLQFEGLWILLVGCHDFIQFCGWINFSHENGAHLGMVLTLWHLLWGQMLNVLPDSYLLLQFASQVGVYFLKNWSFHQMYHDSFLNPGLWHLLIGVDQ